MADLTANTVHQTRPRAGRSSYPVADAVTLGIGALVQLESGYLNHWDETGQFIGIVVGGDTTDAGVLTGDTSATPPVEGRVDESGVVLTRMAVAGTSAASVGVLVYCADSDPANFTVTDTTNPPVGRLVRFRSASDCDVQLFTPTEWQGGNAGTGWAT